MASVTKPGVSIRAPDNASMSPSAISLAGIWPARIFCLARSNVEKPCFRNMAAPRAAVRRIRKIAAQVPTTEPTFNMIQSSIMGRITKSGNMYRMALSRLVKL